MARSRPRNVKRFFIALFALIADSIAHCKALEAQPIDPLVETTKPAVTRVEVRGRDANGVEHVSIGTGFFITPDGFLLTSALFLAPAGLASEWAVTVKTNGRASTQATPIYSDMQTGLALLRVDTSGAPVGYLKLGDSSSVADGTDVVGFGYDTNIAVYRGNIGMIFDARRFGLFRVQMLAQSEANGGPVIAKDGRVIGVIFVDGATTYAIPINLASNLVQITRSVNLMVEALETRVKDLEKKIESYDSRLESAQNGINNFPAAVGDGLKIATVEFDFGGTSTGNNRTAERMIEDVDPKDWQVLGSWLSVEASGFVKDIKPNWWAAGAFGAVPRTIVRDGHFVAELQQFWSFDNGDDGRYNFRLRHTTLFVRKKAQGSNP